TVFQVLNNIATPAEILPGQTIKLLLEFYPAAVTDYEESLSLVLAGDTNTVALTGSGLPAGILAIDQDAISVSVDYQGSTTTDFELSNVGEGPLMYAINHTAVTGQSVNKPINIEASPGKGVADLRTGNLVSAFGSDQYGYAWYDSDSSAVTFEWEDISLNDESIELSLTDDSAEKVDLPFTFRLYDGRFDEVYVSSNGFVSVDEQLANSPLYSLLPNNSGPSGVIAPLWSDLNPEMGGSIYYLITDDEFVVQYQDIQTFDGNGTYTFQVIIAQDGHIAFNYLSVEGNTNGVVGLSSGDNLYGLNIAFNNDYLRDQLAISVTPPVDFISPNILNGILAAGESETITLTINPDDRLGGLYEEVLLIASNDTASTNYELPVLIEVLGTPGIALDSINIRLDSTFVNEVSASSITYINQGTGVLTIDSLSADSEDFFGLVQNHAFIFDENSSINVALFNKSLTLNGSLSKDSFDDVIDFVSIKFGEEEVAFSITEDETHYQVAGRVSLTADQINSIRNGTANMQLFDVDLSLIEMAAMTTPSLSVAPGQTGESINVYFNPSNAGEKEGTLTIFTNAETNAEISLSGFAKVIDRSLDVPTDPITQVLSVGESAQQVFVISNTGTQAVNYAVSTSIVRTPTTGSVNNKERDFVDYSNARGITPELTSSMSASDLASPTIEALNLPDDPSAYVYGGYNDYINGIYHHAFFTIDSIATPKFIERFDNLTGFSNAGEFIQMGGVPHLIEITDAGEMILLNLTNGEFETSLIPLTGLTGLSVHPNTGLL
ncbi:MAG: hypothetical protein AAFO69_14660, partial [Bacteroidota bacterium]